jgi:oligoribonuclease
MEMTGLDPKTCRIIEVAALVADTDFQIKEEYEAVVFQTPRMLGKMDSWCKKTHGESGLTDKVKDGITEAKAEKEILAMIGRHFGKDDPVVLAGNSIGQDRKFIDLYMPKLSKKLHYRMVDVSSYKEFYRAKFGIEVKKKGGHRALEDVRESLDELKYYLSFVQPPHRGKT